MNDNEDRFGVQDFADMLKDWLESPEYNAEEMEEQIDNISSLSECGYLTGNKGLVIDLPNGQRFLLTITEDRR